MLNLEDKNLALEFAFRLGEIDKDLQRWAVQKILIEGKTLIEVQALIRDAMAVVEHERESH